jgi:hypothetical protein
MRGQTCRAPRIGAHLITGEFVALETAAGDARWVGRILRFCSSHELPEGHADGTAGGGDYVQVQWCAIVGEGGEKGHARGMPPPDKAAKIAGLCEIVLMRESSWHRIACVLDAVIVLPTCISHDVSGMEGVFVAQFEQGASGATFTRLAADSVGAFPERNATFRRRRVWAPACPRLQNLQAVDGATDGEDGNPFVDASVAVSVSLQNTRTLVL